LLYKFPLVETLERRSGYSLLRK